MSTPKLNWDWGTAYDLFCSLRVIHEPGHYGLRPAWAAGVRSRVPLEHRTILEQVQVFVFVPRGWIFNLPAPKDGAAVLWFLGKLPPEERLLALVEGGSVPQDVVDILKVVSARGSWTPAEQEALREAYKSVLTPPRPKVLITMLDLFAQAADTGERYLSALRAYHSVFFAEEEEHIRPFLEDAVSNAQKLAEHLPFEDLVESLSRGIRLGAEPESKEWIFIPSYWISPLVSFEWLSDERTFFMFGGRPSDVSLVPGDVVPEGILRAFKALGDPTRLRILRYLSQEDISPAEISRRLRLRAPTVTHHLNLLRLAGLVYLILGEKNERRYAARMDAIEEIYENLRGFLVERDFRIGSLEENGK
jgi:DNA-binding transcriptional ArsR family regulator